jgi:nucleoside 2-deoxyribosyltransferase
VNALATVEAQMFAGAKTVYLAGPISGLKYDGATEWRIGFAGALAEVGIKGLSPMRAKEYLRDQYDASGGFSATCVEYGHLSCLSGPRGIMTRDRFDATRCDVLLVNLLGAERVSIGTMMEVAWADLKRTPIVCIMEPGNIHEHAMLNEAIGFRCTTLEEALTVIKAILL